MYELQRKVHRIGQKNTGSLAVALPKMWAKAHRIKEGDLVTIKFDGDLIVLPMEKNSVV